VSIGRFLLFDRSAIVNADFSAVVAAIDRVHGVGADLSEIPLVSPGFPFAPERQSADAWFSAASISTGIIPVTIAVRLDVRCRRFKTLHEIGHFLDVFGLPGEGFSSATSDELARWRAAVGESQAIRRLMLLRERPDLTGNERLVEASNTDEVWARSYAQFVATRSGDPTLLAELTELRTGRLGGLYYPLQWREEDFRPVAAEIEARSDGSPEP
jgi:hypothetical protein